MKKIGYALWALTLVAVYWAIILVSAVAGGKGITKLREVQEQALDAMNAADSGAGELG